MLITNLDFKPVLLAVHLEHRLQNHRTSKDQKNLKGGKMKQSTRLFVSLLFGLSLGLMGCQGNMDSKNTNPVTTGSAKEDALLGLNAVNEEAQLLEKSVDDALAEVDTISNSEAFGTGLSGLTRITSALLGKTEETIKNVLEKLVGQLDRARAAIDRARERVQDRLDRLDPSNPAHQASIQGLQKVLDDIDQLDMKVDMGVEKVREKMNHFLVKIEDFIAKLRRNPIVNLALQILIARFGGGLAGTITSYLGGLN